MNIEKLLQDEEDNSIRILKHKAGYKGEDFIEDVYCDARLKALKNIHSYDQDRPFKPWWNRILLNSLTDKINREKNETPSEYLEEKQYSDISSIDTRLTVSELVSMLDILPTKQREVLVRVLNEELSTGYSEDVKSAADRLALHKVRKKIGFLLEEKNNKE